MEGRFILMVEDNSSDVKLTQRVFEKEHVANELIVVRDGQEALAKFDSSIAFVITDWNMPNMSGTEFTKVLRSRDIVPILMTSNPFVPKNDNVAMKPYIEACRAVARAEKVPLIDTYAHFAELAVEGRSGLYTDTCHLTPEGNRVVAELMLRSIEAMLQVRPER